MYQKTIDRINPSCVMFLVDESNSMMDGIMGSAKPKAHAMASAINRFLNELIAFCDRGETTPRNYFDIGVIGYTTDEDGTTPLFHSFANEELAKRELVSIVDLYENQDFSLSLDEEAPADISSVPGWYAPLPEDAMHGTPICAVLRKCRGIMARWCAAHRASFPPIVMHVTDGESTDDDFEAEAEALKALGTEDGNLLLLNCHLSSLQCDPVIYPSDPSELPHDRCAQALFRMSSVVPEPLRLVAEKKNILMKPGARAMAFNAAASEFSQLLTVGTRSTVAPAKPKPRHR